jgi:hypothetical protein
MKNIYPKGQNPFAGKKLVNYKDTVIYPKQGSIRFQVQLDKNGQIYDIHQSFAQIIKDSETKKRFIKVTLGDRPKKLYDLIKGRPIRSAVWRIDDYIANMVEE